ncbi:MAG TPA: phage tail sheath subtilisin-like domain-containing protein [Xanthobacteraceae bacterium]|jgi:phage tail sheath gpL-like|nr:phage tail sheath subtilisin-like domain-containing protein [Xanthobacteraceae bacterium]
MGGINTGVPENWLLPLFWATVDGSLAGGSVQSQPALLVGQKLAAGIAANNVPIPIGSLAIAQQQFGIGSMLERMCNAFFNINPGQQLWALPVADPGGGVAATGSLQITANPTAAGTYSLYIAGQLVSVAVGATDTASTIATNVVAAINALTTLPVTATVDGVHNYQVDLTCRWLGATGNDIQLSDSYLGVAGGQALPAGMAVTYTAMAGGAGVPSFTGAISAIQAQQFLHVGLPYTDTASMAAWATEYGFGTTGRWGYQRQQYGWIYQGYRNDYADALTFGLAQNAPVISTMVWEPLTPTSMWEATAAYCAQGAQALLDDPARPLQTLPLTGILPAPLSGRFSQTQINTLAGSGLAVQAVNPSGVPAIVRESTQYQKNAQGQSDTAFSLLTVLSNLAALLTTMSAAISSKYPRHKLAPDGTRFGPGQAIITPTIAKAELVAEARNAEYNGLMSNVTEFIANLVVQIDPSNSSRLQVLWPPQLMGQLRQFTLLAQFRLMYPTVLN